MIPVAEIREENRRLRRIQAIVDAACIRIITQSLSQDQVSALADETRRRVLELAPGDEDKYDLIYTPRLKRFARQFRGYEI